MCIWITKAFYLPSPTLCQGAGDSWGEFENTQYRWCLPPNSPMPSPQYRVFASNWARRNWLIIIHISVYTLSTGWHYTHFPLTFSSRFLSFSLIFKVPASLAFFWFLKRTTNSLVSGFLHILSPLPKMPSPSLHSGTELLLICQVSAEIIRPKESALWSPCAPDSTGSTWDMLSWLSVLLFHNLHQSMKLFCICVIIWSASVFHSR